MSMVCYRLSSPEQDRGSIQMAYLKTVLLSKSEEDLIQTDAG